MIRVGNWMQTFTGRRFYPLDPRPEDVCVEDIAHALSLVCRFGGHVRFHYSVAQHSLYVSNHVDDHGAGGQDVLIALLHDAAEAYIGDVVWPLKQATEMLGYRVVEERVERAVFERFGLPLPLPAVVKHADLVLLATEKRDVVNGSAASVGRETAAAQSRLGPWYCDSVQPLPDALSAWSPREAERIFLARFEELSRS